MEISESAVGRAYAAKTPGSRAFAERARGLFPSGVTHDSRYLTPYPLFITKAQGSRKWDVDGNEYVDYFGGHGSLLLGHNHPAVVEAVSEQITKGTHFGASTELEVRWAELITELVPCAERVRFTSSGTEATQLCMRIARAFTGRKKVLRFATHFHGWHDQVAFGAAADGQASIPAGIPEEIAANIVIVPPNDAEAVRAALESEEVAAVMLEPTGASFGGVPTGVEFLKTLRELTNASGSLLIFDEVISGFRVSPGGAQGHYGVTPDLSVHAKLLAGGYPGGAVVGRADVMDMLSMRGDPRWDKEARIAHYGTFNANPVSASAGIAALQIVKSTDVCEKAARSADVLRDALRDVIAEQGLNWVVYGEFSGIHIFTNRENRDVTVEDFYSGALDHTAIKAGNSPLLNHKIRLGLIVGGVDVAGWPGGWSSAVHTENDLDRTAEAFKKLLVLLKEDPALV